MMKAKLLLGIMLMLIPFNLCLAKERGQKHNPKWECKRINKGMNRSPFLPMIDTEEQNGYLSLTFQFTLSNVDLTIKDSNGNEVVNEQSTTLFEGKTMLIPINEDSYPFSIEISSPTVDIVGKVTLEY